MGITFMAWGNNAPDMFNVASAVSKGMVDLALNAAVAGEIHSILLGLGLPYLIYNIKIKKPIVFINIDIFSFTLFYFGVFLITFMCVLKVNNNKLDILLGVYLTTCYVIYLIFIIIMEFKT
jgi:Ca2+/Na+ antiporter